MATAQDKFKELLLDHFTPWLKERDFKRRDTTFRRRRGDAWQIVNFQRSQFSDAGDVPFTINLGVSLDVLHDEPRWQPRGWPLEHECDLRQRIGALHGGEDHWWKVRPRRPTSRLVKDVRTALEKGLVWLDLHADPDALLDQTLRDPGSASAMNLASLVALAKAVGNERQIEVSEAELRRWQEGKRLAF